MTTRTPTPGSPTTESGTPDRRSQAATGIRQACAQHGVDQAILAAWLPDRDDLRDALDFVFGRTGTPPALPILRGLVREVETRLDLAEPLTVDLAGPAQRWLRLLRSMLAATLLLLSGWTVIGAIFTSQNALAATTSPAATLTVLIVAILALALLEAAHIGAVALSTADVTTLEDSHPHVFRLHRHIDTKHKLEDYLAARQVGVVLIVFVIAEVTRTADLTTLPGTTVSIPAWIGLLFQIGAPGALLVLIVGQVTPQILTARRPAGMMNLLPMAAAFHATRFIGHLGLALPARWLAGWSKSTERIPSAPRERFTSAALDVDGFGTLMIRQDVTVGADHSQIITESTVLFHDAGPAQFTLDVASLPETPARLRVNSSLLRHDERLPVVASQVEEYRAPDRRSLRLPCSFAPRAGTFRAGDVLDASAVAEFDTQVSQVLLVINAPTKLAMIRVILDFPPAPLPPAALTISGQSDGAVYATQTIPVRLNDADGSAEFLAVLHYPEPGTEVALSWAAPSSTTSLAPTTSHSLLN